MPSPPEPVPATPTDLLDLLETGALLVTPDAPSARALRRLFDDRQRARSHAVWQPASVLSWSQFTTGLWSSLIVDGREPRLLLNPLQEHSLWREVVAATAAGPLSTALTSPDTLAELAASAFLRAAAYRALPHLRSAANSPDTRTFAAWAEAFLRLLDTRQCLAPAQLDEALAAHLATGALLPGTPTLPATLHLLAGVNPHSAQQLLLSTLTAAGVAVVSHRPVQPRHAPPAHHLVADPHTELQFVADTLAQLFASAHPPATVTLLLPDLAADRAELDSVLRATLAPALNHIAADLAATPWEFAAGTPLAAHALIADALDLLRLATGPLPLPRLTNLLRSPFFGQPGQQDTAARFDAWLRGHYRGLRPELDLPTLAHHLRRYSQRSTANAYSSNDDAHNTKAAVVSNGAHSSNDNAHSSNVNAHSSDVNAHSTTTTPSTHPLTWPLHLAAQLERSPLDPTRPRSCSDWSDALRTLLQAVDFPPTANPTPTLFALSQAWDGLLDTIATLDFAARRVPLASILDTLERLAASTPFTPPSAHARIQIAPYSAMTAALQDTVLVLRATDANLPPRAQPHPLLPWSLQRSLAMPGTDPIRDAAQTRAAFHDLLAASRQVLLVSAAEDATGKLRPSPLLAECGIPTTLAPALLPVAARVPYDLVRDDAPLPPSPTDVPGGSQLLTLQAACGFRAFAEFRLHATEPDDPGLGLDARTAGSLLHDTLHHLWTDLHSQQALLATPPAERIERIDRAIDQAFAQRFIPERSPWDSAYTQIVTRRLRNLLLDWLAIEEQRGPFTIASLETAEPITVGPLTLSVRIDRIDAVADAAGDPGVLFIDYKTSASASPRQWENERPEDPQLPLYALLSIADPAQVKGLAFARIRAGSLRYHGIHTEAGILPTAARDIVRDIPALLTQWQATLQQLAHDFHTGDVRVNPLNYPTTCQYCRQRLLCRLDPATLAQPDDPDDPAPEFTAPA